MESENLPQDGNSVWHLGDIGQDDRLVPENFVNFRSEFEEDIRSFQELIGQEGEHRW